MVKGTKLRKNSKAYKDRVKALVNARKAKLKRAGERIVRQFGPEIKIAKIEVEDEPFKHRIPNTRDLTDKDFSMLNELVENMLVRLRDDLDEGASAEDYRTIAEYMDIADKLDSLAHSRS